MTVFPDKVCFLLFAVMISGKIKNKGRNLVLQFYSKKLQCTVYTAVFSR